jgi:predicted secreted protein
MGTNSTKGTVLQVSIATVFTPVTQRTSIKPNTRKRNEIETTDLDSADEASIPGIRRAGELEVSGNLDPAEATHAYLLSSYLAGANESWKLILADAGAATDAFSGWIMEHEYGEAKVDQLQTYRAKIKITGATTLTP